MTAPRFGWAALAFGCLVFSWHYSRLAPVGAWGNEIFGEWVWGEADPGSIYFAAAHQVGWREPPFFVGHPGATLVPLLRLVQSALYHLGADGDVSFSRFTAQQLPQAFLASKLLMTLLHLLSFVALYRVARRLLGECRAAALAVLGYATSLPVLYYLSRISVEPLMMLFFAGSFLAIWRYEDLAPAGRPRAALCFAGLAGVAAVSCAMSKFAFGAPLPFLLALELAAGTGASGVAGAIDRRTRGRALACFAAAGLAALALYSQIIDWRSFIIGWDMVIRSGASGRAWELSGFVPGLRASRIFPTAELGFLTIAAAGCWLFLRDRPDERRRALWLCSFGGYGLALFLYRVALEGNFLAFHYSFVLLAVAAVFFGHASDRVWRRWSVRAGWRSLALGLLWLGGLHGVAAAAVVESRRHDARAFAKAGPAFPLIARLRPGDRLGVARSRGRPIDLGRELDLLHAMDFPFVRLEQRSPLQLEFEAFFVFVPPEQMAQARERVFVPALDAHVVLLPGSRDGAPGGF